MKVDMLRIIEFVSVLIFGFTGFLYTVFQWCGGNIQTTVIFAILFVVVISVIGIGAALVSDKFKKGKDGD